RKQKWLESLNIQNYDPPKSAAVCSEHFKEQDYESNHSYRKLKKDAIPYLTEDAINDKENIDNTNNTKIIIQNSVIQHKDTQGATSIVENMYNDKEDTSMCIKDIYIESETTYNIQEDIRGATSIVENIYNDKRVIHRSTSISPQRIFDSPAKTRIRKHYTNQIKKLKNQLYTSTYKYKKARETIKSLKEVLKDQKISFISVKT
ncbi:PREDICTED: uncharacterized protein LOC105555934, partial [Vollenhovia emeryi]|uniref:uncharacterized protein LOC105555934 n=1 Tax=Vollenhovia emeryi TaxID=411798 RepID=UPI0005F51D92